MAAARCWAVLWQPCQAVLLAGLALAVWLSATAGSGGAEIELPVADPQASVAVRADRAHQWQQGSYQVWLLRGNCQIRQAELLARSQEAVLWIDRGEPLEGQPSKVLAYLEGDVSVDYVRPGQAHRASGRRTQTFAGGSWFGRFQTVNQVDVQAPVAGREPAVKPAVFQRGVAARNPQPDPGIRQAQFSVEEIAPGTPVAPSRRVVVRSRSHVRPQARVFTSPDRDETVTVVTSGVRLTIDPGDAPPFDEIGVIEIETDNLVLWATGLQTLDLSGQALEPGDVPLELYLEGNIVFRQGDRVIYADRMYYNVAGEHGVVLAAEVLTPVPEYQGLLRLKADVLQQVNRHNFLAYGAAATSSRMGVPKYWFQSELATFQDVQTPVLDPVTGQPVIHADTGRPAVDHQLLATSRNNFLYAAGWPIFYWPVLATDLTKPSFYIDQTRITNDRIFGLQFATDYDLYHLFGVREPPAGTRWTLTTSGMSQRGLGLGTQFQYDREGQWLAPGPYQGLLHAWALFNERGLDNLGADRRALAPEQDFRGRVLWQHRHHLPNDFQLTGELGLISDRNFLEQYYEREWDLQKDQATGLELKQFRDNSTWSLAGDVRLNDFFTETEWLPRLDHFLIGQSLFQDRFTWHAHSHVGYGRLRTATAPLDPVDAAKFDPLAWEADRQGIRAATRQELDLPVELGPVKFVPYLLGEAGHWGEDLDGASATRLYGQAGVRASLPMWRADPTVQNTLFNLNGLAHKVVFESELLWADANQDLSRFPLYDPLDDNSQQHFRRRFFFDTFDGMPGGDIPLPFDERFYALRTGMQSWVTAPSTEIADDLMLARMGVRQRWQTRRGLPGQERIVDWLTLDVQGTLFPKPNRDNFGQDLGMLNYDMRWHVGDRFSVLSDGYADLFPDGLRMISLGGLLTRPEQGSLYLGFRSLEGPISSNALSTAVSYRMSEKWIATGGSTIDFSSTGNVRQNLAFTRIGESTLVQLGFFADASRNNVGVQLAIEPRFLPAARLGQVGGVQIPPAGARGLE